MNPEDEPELEAPESNPEEPPASSSTAKSVTGSEITEDSEGNKSNIEDEGETPIEPKDDLSNAQPSNPNYDERTSNALAVSKFD